VAFASNLGLRSTLIALHTEASDVAPPPPPPPGSLGQVALPGSTVSPDQAASSASALLHVPALPAGPPGGHVVLRVATPGDDDPVRRMGMTALASLLLVSVLTGLARRRAGDAG
jgi:hypothetical protein